MPSSLSRGHDLVGLRRDYLPAGAVLANVIPAGCILLQILLVRDKFQGCTSVGAMSDPAVSILTAGMKCKEVVV